MEDDDELLGTDSTYEEDTQSDCSEASSPITHRSPRIPKHLQLPVDKPREDRLFDSLLPYPIESLDQMDDELEVIIKHLMQCAMNNDFEIGFEYWHAMLEGWLDLRYPMKRCVRARLIAFYYNLAVSPGMEPTRVKMMVKMTLFLIKSTRHLDVRELQLDWDSLYDVLKTEIEHPQSPSTVTNIYTWLFHLAGYSSRYFPPHTALDMLDRFLPKFTPSNIDTMITTQSLICHFLPITHPSPWLNSIFRLWATFQSRHWTEQWLELLSRLSQKHVDPNISDPRLECILKNLAPGENFDEKSLQAISTDVNAETWPGIHKHVGIYTERQWSFIMTQCMRLFGLRFGVQGSNVTATDGAKNADSKVTSRVTAMLRPSDALESFATIIVYSMSEDGDSSSPACRALGALSKLLTAMETFFHPSNHGSWSAKLAKFLRHLAWRFATRCSEEAKTDCSTPDKWRLTDRIKHQFVSMLMNPVLMSMFSKDVVTSGWTQIALKTMAYLQPDLVLPPIIERSLLALEGLLETHRTTACIAALTPVMGSMLDTVHNPSGAANLPILLDLLLPGIDSNDASKTMHSAVLVSQVLGRIKISDPTLIQESRGMFTHQPPHSALGTIDHAHQDMVPDLQGPTTFLSEWAMTYFKRVLSFFENLPEPRGKQEKTGGKIEEHTITRVCCSFDELCKSISPELFPSMLGYFKSYICDNVRSNMVRTIGLIASALDKGFADPITFRTCFVLCDSKIRAELEAGAASVHTMSTDLPRDSELQLHWFFSILIGISTKPSGRAMLEHKNEIMSLLHVMLRDCKSKRSYKYVSKYLHTTLCALIETYPAESRFLNPDEWNATAHQSLWGKTYKMKDVKVKWHVPSSEEIDFALLILDEIVAPMIQKIDEMLEQSFFDHDAKCEFVKLCMVARAVVFGTAALAVLEPPAEPGDPISDWREPVLGRSSYTSSANAGVPLSAADPRHAKVTRFRIRLSESMHRAAARLTIFNDNIECVKAIIGVISSLLIDPASEEGVLENHKHAYKTLKHLNQIFEFQNEYPRVVWVRYARLLHLTRLGFPRPPRLRSVTDDKLIKDLFEFSVSSWVVIRRLTQKTLTRVVRIYDGSRGLLLGALFDCLRPGNDPDRMKGALYVLASKPFSSFCMQDGRYRRACLSVLLQCQHSDKSSIQSIVSSLLQHHSCGILERETLRNTIRAKRFHETIDDLNSQLSKHALDNSTCERLRDRRMTLTDGQEEECQRLVFELVDIAKAPTTHWKYSLNAQRLLIGSVRRDQPLSPVVASHFAQEMLNSPLPAKRNLALNAISHILYFVKLRTMCKSDENLLRRHSYNPLKISIDFPSPRSPQDFEHFMAKLQCPLSQGPEYLVDKLNTGWLICGQERAYRLPQKGDLILWDPDSEPALCALREVMEQESYWTKLGAHLSQEQGRKHLALNNVMVLKSIFQVFREEFWPTLLPTLEELVRDSADRHKQRAAAEIICGVIRGTKHWSMDKQEIVWNWFEMRFKSIYDAISPDGLVCWLMCIEAALHRRDPRRNQVIIDFIFSLETDSYTSAFAASKAHQFVGAVIKALSWPFLQPHLKRCLDIYWASINHDYLEVRNCVSLNLKYLIEHQTHPSFASVADFLQDCGDEEEGDSPLAVTPALVDDAIARVLRDFHLARETRLPAQHGNQEYDKCAMTCLTWLWSSLNNSQCTAIYPFIPGIIPELFYMHELIDNQELSRLSYVVLGTLTCMPWPMRLVKSILETLLKLSQAVSWKVRLDTLKVMRAFFFHQLYTLTRPQVDEMLHCICVLLEDQNMEVREAAATTLSGLVHCSERTSILNLKTRFTQTLRDTQLPKHRFEGGVERPNYQATMIKIHAAVLGSSALINAFPYDVPAWVPEVLINNICSHMSSAVMISTTARETLTVFKKTHLDTWAEGQKMFNQEELATLNDCLIGSSYYA